MKTKQLRLLFVSASIALFLFIREFHGSTQFGWLSLSLSVLGLTVSLFIVSRIDRGAEFGLLLLLLLCQGAIVSELLTNTLITTFSSLGCVMFICICWTVIIVDLWKGHRKPIRQ